MALPPPAKPAPAPQKPAPTPLELARVLEGHIDTWIKGQGPGWSGGDVPIGDHQRHAAPVLAELVALYHAAGWAGAKVTDDPDRGAVLHLAQTPAPAAAPVPAPDPADVTITP